MVFRSHLPAYKPTSSGILAYPHTITKCVVQGEKKEFKQVIENDSPIVDPRLSANWTDISELSANGVSISPISSYITSSLEERMNVLNDSVRALTADIEFVKSQKTVPVPSDSVPTDLVPADSVSADPV